MFIPFPFNQAGNILVFLVNSCALLPKPADCCISFEEFLIADLSIIVIDCFENLNKYTNSHIFLCLNMIVSMPLLKFKDKVTIFFVVILVLGSIYFYLNHLQQSYDSVQWSGERCLSELTSIKYQLNGKYILIINNQRFNTCLICQISLRNFLYTK